MVCRKKKSVVLYQKYFLNLCNKFRTKIVDWYTKNPYLGCAKISSTRKLITIRYTELKHFLLKSVLIKKLINALCSLIIHEQAGKTFSSYWRKTLIDDTRTLYLKFTEYLNDTLCCVHTFYRVFLLLQFFHRLASIVNEWVMKADQDILVCLS